MKRLFALFTVYDLALAALLLALAVAVFLGLGRPADADAGAWLEVSRDGTAVASYPLDADISVELQWQGRHNLLVIEDGRAYIAAADCPDQYCVAHAPVSHVNEVIVCLPARLVLTVRGGEAGALDAVSQ